MVFETFKQTSRAPLGILFGTDWWSDCDDVAALDILLKAQCNNLVQLKAIGINSVMRYSAASVKALCEQYGLGNIPIGLDTSATRRGVLCLYQKKLAAFCRSSFSNADCPEAYKLYRCVLANTREKAVIVDVGFPNLLMELLLSPSDEYSELSGSALVKEKVKEIILMGGRWDRANRKEYNFSAFPVNRKAAQCICECCPVPLTFLGYEAGKNIITGGKTVPGLTGLAYAAHLSGKGRPSWDPMTALYAIIGDAESAGYRRIRGTAAVDADSGRNRFEISENGMHAYLEKTREDAFYRRQINDILMLQL